MTRKPANTSLAFTERFVLAISLAGLAVLFTQGDWLWRWDNLLYDTQLSFWNRPASENIVIITIDDYSLSEIGHWPWPRSIHANLLNRLNKENPKAIGLDIIFSEADSYHPEQDVLLAQAIKNSRNVVLPIYMTKKNSRSFPVEAFPLPVLAQHAAIGHVHIDLSDDGIARQVYLYQGIGEARWPHFALALLELANKSATEPAANAQADAENNKNFSLPQWFRKQAMLIPFAGPPGHFQQISYTQVLNGQFQPGFFDKKIVLIGATAEGMGDILPTPFSGHSRAMPGVEINANILDALMNNIEITAIGKNIKTLFITLLALAPLVAFQYLKPRTALLSLMFIMLSTVALSGLLLWVFHLWLSPAIAILFQLITYPLWSWRKLEHAIRHLNQELNGLNQQRKNLSIHRHTSISRSISFIRLFIPINGWVLVDEAGRNIKWHGSAPKKDKGDSNRTGWNMHKYSAWANLRYNNNRCRLGLSFQVDTMITADEQRLLDQLLLNLQESEKDNTPTTDFLEEKIQQIQLAENNLLKLRQFIDDGLSHMSDGVIVCDTCGEILMSNKRASWYLMGDDNDTLNNLSLQAVLNDLHLAGNATWTSLLQKVLVMRKRVITQAKHSSGRDLMVQISPLNSIAQLNDGLVINLSDIQLLTASEKRRDELLNFLTHDLRSPLSSTLALIELEKTKLEASKLKENRLREHKPGETKPIDAKSDYASYNKTLDKITFQTQKTLHLADQFLHLSRVKNSEDLLMYDIDFNTVVLNGIEQTWHLAKNKGIQISQSYAQEELWIRGEPDLLERAIVNLVSNAIKYSDNNTTIRVYVSTDDDNIYCHVIDEGYGISTDDLPNLFDLFKRVQRSGEKRKLGIGLGLAFVDAVAKRHQGHVHVESTAGLGSDFCLTLPLQQHKILS